MCRHSQHLCIVGFNCLTHQVGAARVQRVKGASGVAVKPPRVGNASWICMCSWLRSVLGMQRTLDDGYLLWCSYVGTFAWQLAMLLLTAATPAIRCRLGCHPASCSLPLPGSTTVAAKDGWGPVSQAASGHTLPLCLWLPVNELVARAHQGQGDPCSLFGGAGQSALTPSHSLSSWQLPGGADLQEQQRHMCCCTAAGGIHVSLYMSQ